MSGRRVLGFVLALVACDEVSDVGPAEIHITPGAIAPDSMLSVVAGQITIEARERGGVPLAGALIRLVGRSEKVSPYIFAPSLILTATDGAGGGTELVHQADARGRLVINASRGPMAGTGYLVASLPLKGVRDSIPFTIHPGAARSLTLGPRDTAVFVDAAFPVRTTVRDAQGNTVPTVPTLLSDSAAITLDGLSLRAASVGRARIVATSGSLTDSMFVSVVPEATFAVLATPGIVMVRGDGTSARTLAAANVSAGQSWAPDGRTVAFSSGVLYLASVDAPVRRLISGTPPFQYECWPQFSRDGDWIYFGSGTESSGNGCGGDIWRIHPDGVGLERVNPTRPVGAFYHHPSPSPDGARLAFTFVHATSGYPVPVTIAIMDVATGGITDLSISGMTPRWSPDGAFIAFFSLDERIAAVRPDASDFRYLTPAGRRYLPGVDWSPDSRWVVAAAGQTVHVIEANSGRLLPLTPLTGAPPIWRP